MRMKRSQLAECLRPRLPQELKDAAWVYQDTSVLKEWTFSTEDVYRIDGDYLRFSRKEGKHHIFQSFFAKWLTSFTNIQIIRSEVLKMEKGIRHCPHCDGSELKVELKATKAKGVFLGMVTCTECKSVTTWKVSGIPSKKNPDPAEENLSVEERARFRLIKAWNRREAAKETGQRSRS